jgi:hypothetical protein
LRAGQVLIAFMLVAVPIAFLPAQDAEPAPDAAPVVSPDRLEDVPQLKATMDAFPTLDKFAWRVFIALNWPSLTDPAHRGVADRTKRLGDPGPRVWETFKARYELFQVDANGSPTAAPPWATYDGANPCGAGVNNRGKTLASFDAFRDFNQAGFLGVAVNPLVAQNRTYTRYETRINEPEYSALAASGWSQGQNLPDPDHPARLPAGSIAVKAAWRILTGADTPAVRARYYVVKNANVVDVAKTTAAGHVVCTKSDVALVALHLVIRTPHRPQGVWSSFEHVDNVPPVGTGAVREPDARNANAPYSYFDASKPKLGLWSESRTPDTSPVSLDHPPQIDPAPMQVVRRHPIHASTMTVNREYWTLPGIKGTVWEHYMLVVTQWPTQRYPIDPHNEGAFFPDARKENMVSTVIETYLQDPPSSCIACHKVFNERGHDFIGMLNSFR